SGKAVEDVLRPELALEPAVHNATEVGDLRPAHLHPLGPLLVGNVRGADQQVIALIGIDEDHPAVVVLEEIGLASRVALAHDDVAAPDKPHAFWARPAQDAGKHLVDPGAGCIDQAARGNAVAGASLLLQLDSPEPLFAAGGDAGRSRKNPGPAGRRVEGIQDDE